MAANIGQKTLDYCRKQGWEVQKVEHWNNYAKKKYDLFGCIDYLALDSKTGVLGIQATTNAHAAARIQKCRATIPPLWFVGGNRLEVWDWAKRGPAGKRKLWTLKRIPILLSEILTT